jgi:hypothetical protein
LYGKVEVRIRHESEEIWELFNLRFFFINSLLTKAIGDILSISIDKTIRNWSRKKKIQWCILFMNNQTFSFVPKSKLGKLSVILILLMFMLFVIGISFTNSLYKSTPAGGSMLQDIYTRPALAITMLMGMLAGISSFFTGLMAIIRKKEKAVLVYFSTIIGALLLILLIGEFFEPH